MMDKLEIQRQTTKDGSSRDGYAPSHANGWWFCEDGFYMLKQSAKLQKLCSGASPTDDGETVRRVGVFFSYEHQLKQLSNV